MEEISIAEIQGRLMTMQDLKYQEFQSMLLPNIKSERIIGVRTPELRSLAREMYTKYDCSTFLNTLPHEYFEENQIHAFIISETRDFDLCMKQFEAFLPFVNNWATCDQSNPKVFNTNREKAFPYIQKWISSGKTYTVRFGISLLMRYYLDEDFKGRYLDMVASLCRTPGRDQDDNYYVNMMISWFFATALAKQWNQTLPIIKNRTLNPWCHKKTIQKAIESYRISDKHKEILKGLR